MCTWQLNVYGTPQKEIVNVFFFLNIIVRMDPNGGSNEWPHTTTPYIYVKYKRFIIFTANKSGSGGGGSIVMVTQIYSIFKKKVQTVKFIFKCVLLLCVYFFHSRLFSVWFIYFWGFFFFLFNSFIVESGNYGIQFKYFLHAFVIPFYIRLFDISLSLSHICAFWIGIYKKETTCD